MGQWPRGEGRFPYILIINLSLVFVFLTLRTVSAVSHCRVNFCSRKYSHAIEHQQIVSGANYRYCHLLQKYSECIEATEKKCLGDLDFHSIKSYVTKGIAAYNCKEIIAEGPSATLDPPSSTERTVRPRPFPEECSYRGSTSKFSHCGVFGDPHLKTFLNEFQTCKALGAWPLIDNPYLAVQATNDRVNPHIDVTALTKVTVIIRDHSPCTTEKTYEAQTNDLPGYFVDGSKISGPSKDVKILEEEPGSRVEITIRHIDTKIIIRQIGTYLSFAIRMPQEVAMLGSSGDSLELCAKGCPKREMIDHTEIISGETRSWSAGTYTLRTAEAACRFHNVTDIYFDACVFDLLTTGNDTFIYASLHAMKDAISLGHSPPTGNNRTRTPPVIPKNGDKYRAVENGAPGRPWVFALLVIIASFANQIWI